jgi:hypothetical protein
LHETLQQYDISGANHANRLMGRPREMTRRIAAILLLEPALDANYERVKAVTYSWPAK